ncbi:hypothetical protein [Rugamonas sp.]|nr:hypothetical protein [Rugamonas sp.]
MTARQYAHRPPIDCHAMKLPLLYFSTLAYTTLIVAWICYAGYCR